MGCVKLVLFMLLYPFLCQLAFSSSLPHLCPKDQAFALLQFNHMFSINPNASADCFDITGLDEIRSYTKTLSWNKSTDCCSWDGVHCDETTGQVIELDLRCSGLQGKFHSNCSLFQLSNLKRLDLSFNNFSGSLISPKFGEFSSLTHLDLARSRFTGLIPAEISHLSKLYVLRISNVDPYELRLEPYNFELLLKNLTQLRELRLNYVNISSTIPKPLWNLTHIESLFLSHNHLEGPICQFSRFGNLKELSLRNNKFDGQLEFLSLNRSWTQLEWLDFSLNSLTGPIPYNVSGLQNLRILYFSSNYLNGTIPSWIFSLPSLEQLGLRSNAFSGKIREFKSNTLLFVSVKQNKLQGPIPKSLLDQQSLLVLILSQNNFSGQIASTVCNLKRLLMLDLGSNNLEGTIPQCLGEMSELQGLDLSNNSLGGIINTTFRIGNQLQVINLAWNKLEGKVPRSLINCKYLELLDFSNNELSDTFPKWLGALPDLKILSLRSNKLYGPVKYSKSDNLFAEIRVIDLSSNGLSGDLPVRFFENFEAMKITGEKSGTREYVADILSYYYTNSLIVTTKGLDLQFHRFLIGNMIIDLSRNRFEGHIPNIIGDLIGLRALNLSHNVLEGHIPESLHQLSALESLDLSSNKIGGEIPQQLASLTFLSVINLSHNHLVGCIPRGKQFDTFQDISYQGNDGLRGYPLSKNCGGDDGVPQAKTPVELDEEEEGGDSPLISWQAVLMGYGCGLVIGLSLIYIMLSTQYPAWLSRIDVELEHRIIMRMKRHKKRC